MDKTHEAISAYFLARAAWAARPARPLTLDGAPDVFDVLLTLYTEGALHIPTVAEMCEGPSY